MLQPLFIMMLIWVLTALSSTEAVTLEGLSSLAVSGSDFTFTCSVPEEANIVELYRRPNRTPFGRIQVANGKCYNMLSTTTNDVCNPGVCNCSVTSSRFGNEFRWIIQPQIKDNGSVWYCRRTHSSLSDQFLHSPDYTLNIVSTLTLSGSSDYAVAGREFKLTCYVPDTASQVQLHRRVGSTLVGSLLVHGGKCYNRNNNIDTPDTLCSPDVCSCTPTSDNYGTVFQWVIRPQVGDHGSVLYCSRTNAKLPKPDQVKFSPNYTLSLGYGPISVTLNPSTLFYSIPEGQTLPSIRCLSDCNPACTSNWEKDGRSYTPGSDLRLTNIQRNQTGLYWCTVRNSYGEKASGGIALNVTYGPREVDLNTTTTYLSPREGGTPTTIRCSSDCNPVCTYRWTKDGQSYTTGSDLRLTNIRRSQTGVYWCTASNAYGSQTSSDINIIVNQSHITGDGAETTRNTGVVLISVGSVMILLSLLVFAVAIFMFRKGRLPYGRQNTTGKGRSTSTLPRSEDIGGFGHDRYEDLNLDQIEPPSVYDEVSNSPPDNGNNTTGNTRNVYEHLQRQSTANTYEDIPPKPGTGSDGMYVNTAPN